MKKLSKVKLINWHIFSDLTVNLKNQTFEVGKNISNNSAFLDAFRFLLGEVKGNINLALPLDTSPKKMELSHYVRGKIDALNKEYIRKNNVITHIALEFYDEDTLIKSVVGTIITLTKKQVLKTKYYALENIGINDFMFIQNQKPTKPRQMKRYVRKMGAKMRFLDKEKYNKAVENFFGTPYLN